MYGLTYDHKGHQDTMRAENDFLDKMYRGRKLRPYTPRPSNVPGAIRNVNGIQPGMTIVCRYPSGKMTEVCRVMSRPVIVNGELWVKLKNLRSGRVALRSLADKGVVAYGHRGWNARNTVHRLSTYQRLCRQGQLEAYDETGRWALRLAT
jgi:hypothetical protein